MLFEASFLVSVFDLFFGDGLFDRFVHLDGLRVFLEDAIDDFHVCFLFVGA